MAARKVAPALAAGCTAVLKPADLTPLSAALFAQVAAEAGVPDGVLNVVQTTSAGPVTAPMIQDARLRKLSFTGSTAVGRRLLADAAPNVLRTSMELGGNAPFLVFEDADLDAAVVGAVQAKLRNMGEACTAANRFLVHESVADEFARRLADRVATMTLGPGAENGTEIGPLIDERSRQKVHRLVTEAIDAGADAVTGARPLEGPGYFYPPTVLTGVDPASRLVNEEIFGPVAPISTFSTEDEAVRLANATEYGLVAYVFTQNLERGLRMAERIESGMLGFNTGVVSNAAAPFGGVKHSGLGREGGAEGIDEYLSVMYMGLPDPHAVSPTG
jgi:succinate-semialdehyde dehydrogenase/glutarate-semialdehyde dehydrogenase